MSPFSPGDTSTLTPSHAAERERLRQRVSPSRCTRKTWDAAPVTATRGPAGPLRDEHADQRKARGRLAELLVGGPLDDREADRDDHLPRLQRGFEQALEELVGGDRALVGLDGRIQRRAPRMGSQAAGSVLATRAADGAAGCAPSDRRCCRRARPAPGSPSRLPASAATVACVVIAPIVTRVAVDLDAAQLGDRAEVHQRRARTRGAASSTAPGSGRRRGSWRRRRRSCTASSTVRGTLVVEFVHVVVSLLIRRALAACGGCALLQRPPDALGRGGHAMSSRPSASVSALMNAGGRADGAGLAAAFHAERVVGAGRSRSCRCRSRARRRRAASHSPCRCR